MTDLAWFKGFVVALLAMAVIMLSHISFQLRHLEAISESLVLQHQIDSAQLQLQTVLMHQGERQQ